MPAPNETGSQPSGEPQAGANQTPNIPEQAPEPTPRGLKGAGLRYTEDDGVPDWAIGKTADEIVGIAEQRRTYVATQPSAPSPQQTPARSMPDGSLVYDDVNAFTSGIKDYVDNQLSATLTGAAQPLIGLARDAAMRDEERRDVWRRYGPEIDAVMAPLPAQQRADVNMWKQAAELVAGRHFKELARAEAERLMQTGETGMLPTGGAPSTPSKPSDPIEALFAERHPAIQSFLDEGISADKVRKHAAAMGHSPDAYAEMLRNKRTLRVPSHA